MKLVLHIGTHKTATTTIQKVLSKNRQSLIARGLWYPAYSEVLPGIRDHYAHLDVAKGLMSESKKLTPEAVEQFFKSLHDQVRRMPRVETVLLSSEPFYRGRMPGRSPYWESREVYISTLRQIIPFDEVEVALVLRRQDDYLESLYNEHIKTTRYSKDIWSFLSDYRSRFEYRQQIELWVKYFPVLKVCTFEELVDTGNVTKAFLRAIGGPEDLVLEEAVEESNVSLPIDLIEFKRLLNGSSLDRNELAELVSILEAVAVARGNDNSVRRSRLSADDRRKLLAEFSEDNDWINETYFARRSESLFSSGIKEMPLLTPLDMKSFADITAEVMSSQLLLPKK